IRVLVTGDVASEGVNLHSHCHQLIHYDIPWSLIRIEQRNGRIDRYGQKHPPVITTLLLDPRTTRRFGGDLRVLTALVRREHEAHTALGDSASLMGEHSVTAEEKKIAEVLRGARDLDDVVAPVASVAEDSGPAGLLARLMGMGAAPSAPAPQDSAASTPPTNDRTGVYDDDLAFLDDALTQVFVTPGLEPDNGVAWTTHADAQVASMKPPRDLRQRLEVLPQSYLAARRVTQTLRLATSPTRGRTELANARTRESTSIWPEAHYLAPLHPVLEWASDRALASLGRNQVFAVRGGVDAVTVLVQATLTNTRGQVVAASFLTVGHPNPANPSFALLEAHPSVVDAVTALDLAPTNTGPVAGAERLDAFVRHAVELAQVQVEEHVAAVRDEATQRVRDWESRARRWRMTASTLFDHMVGAARGDLARRQDGIDTETRLAQEMAPDKTLVRPLLVVLPHDMDLMNEKRGEG